jgi:D-sedoheptulose 7-phosphate isomerase
MTANILRTNIERSLDVHNRLMDACFPALTAAADALFSAYRAGRKALFFGNGGSAADAQHLATEFVIRMNPAIKRPGIPAIALTTDSSLLTAGANDLGYDNVFARAVETLGVKGDILIGISTSGASESVNRALRRAREIGLNTIGLIGKSGGTMKDLVDVPIIVPSDDTQRIQEGHITIGHIICALVERELYA